MCCMPTAVHMDLLTTGNKEIYMLKTRIQKLLSKGSAFEPSGHSVQQSPPVFSGALGDYSFLDEAGHCYDQNYKYYSSF